MTTAFTELDSEALDALIARVQQAKEHNLALSPEDCQLLIDALLSLVTVQEKLADNDITIGKLRKLAGMVQSSETLGSQVSAGKAKRQTRRKKPETPPVKPKTIKHTLKHECKGDVCPECGKGKLYKYEPATFLRITGQSPFVPEQHVMERLRCNACGTYFTADLPKDVEADGEPGQKYGYTARTLMALGKFYAGTPYYRQGSLQSLLGVNLTASTVWDQAELLANDIFPVFRYLRNVLAADALHYEMDDTTNRIVDQQPIEKKKRNSEKTQIRTGVYTSGVIATTGQGQRIVLFDTGIGHAGEFMDEILKNRSPSEPPPLIMSDALASNKPTVIKNANRALCNAHARRQFYDVLSHFPQEVEDVIKRYGSIWANEDETLNQQMSPAERLAYHKAHSLPVMADLRDWGNQMLKTERVEANSGLGKAIRYLDNHYGGLTCFCHVEGARLDNNAMEGQLKLVVRNRKNAGFFKSGTGAAVGDVITSLVATCAQNGLNPFDYLNRLQRNAEDVKAHPEKYLPWDESSQV